jgi:hypothetical protein
MSRDRGLDFPERPVAPFHKVRVRSQQQMGGPFSAQQRADLQLIQMEQYNTYFFGSGGASEEVHESPKLQHGGPQAKDIIPNPIQPKP